MRNALLIFLLLTSSAFGRTITLHWDASKTPNVTYNIYRGLTSGSEIKITTGIQGLSYTDTSAPETDVYYWATASSTTKESIPSNEVKKDGVPGQVKNVKTKVD